MNYNVNANKQIVQYYVKYCMYARIYEMDDPWKCKFLNLICEIYLGPPSPRQTRISLFHQLLLFTEKKAWIRARYIVQAYHTWASNTWHSFFCKQSRSGTVLTWLTTDKALHRENIEVTWTRDPSTSVCISIITNVFIPPVYPCYHYARIHNFFQGEEYFSLPEGSEVYLR